MTKLSADALVTQVRDRILDGTLTPGSALNQVGLAEEFGVSRIPLREALRSLQGEGLVVLEAGQGARVVEHSHTDIADLYDLRLRLEPPLAADIIDSLAPTDVRQLRHLAQQMEQEVRPADWSDLNRRFHLTMYEHIGRHHTLRIVRQLIDLVEPYSHSYVHHLAGLHRASQEHHAMVATIDSQDPDGLEDLLHTHLATARDTLLAALNGTEEGT